MPAPLRAAVIGVGYLGRFHAQKYAQLESCELIGVADADPERRAAAAEALGVPAHADSRELLADAQAVSVAVPTPAHHAVARAALEAGCHVLVEKPFTRSVAEASELIALARARGLVLQIGLLERFNAAFVALLERLERPRFLEVHRLAPWNSRGTEVDVTLDLMIHDIDLALTLVGEEPSEIRASGAAVVGDTLDIANARLEFPGGCVANVTASRLSARSERKLRVFQPRSCAALDLHRRELDLYELRPGAGDPERRIARATETFEETDSLLLEIRDFADCIARGRRPTVSGEDGLRALSTALEITRRMRAGTPA